MSNQTFTIILTIFGLILTSSIHGAPGVTDINQSTNETSTEKTTQINETVTENHTNSTNDCPTGWWFLEGNCYLFSKKKLSFEKAQNSCMGMNATLFEPKNLKTNDLVFEKAKNVSDTWKSKYKFFWIGIHDSNKEGNFTYVSDQNEDVIQWTNWNEGEPNNFQYGEDCVYSHDHGEWNDMNCTVASEFICEKPVNGSAKIFSNFGKKDSNTTDQPDDTLSSNRTQNPSTNPDLKIEISREIRTNVTESITSGIERNTEALVQNNITAASPLVDSSSKSVRKFDGWSFFGGIILTISTAVISFFGTKYYKSRRMTRENYNLM